MDRPLRIFLIVSIIFAGILGLAYWGLVGGEQSAEQSTDPLLQLAEQKAQRTISELHELFVARPSHTFIQHQVNGAMVWSQVNSIEDTMFWVTVMKDWEVEAGNPSNSLLIESSDINDWLVELPDGNVKGGFTTQAQLIRQRQAGEGDRQRQDSLLNLFIDPLD